MAANIKLRHIFSVEISTVRSRGNAASCGLINDAKAINEVLAGVNSGLAVRNSQRHNARKDQWQQLPLF